MNHKKSRYELIGVVVTKQANAKCVEGDGSNIGVNKPYLVDHKTHASFINNLYFARGLID